MAAANTQIGVAEAAYFPDLTPSAFYGFASSTRLTINQYKAGTVDYTSVVTAQATRLNSEITALNIQSGRLTASVALVSALGGGWKNAL